MMADDRKTPLAIIGASGHARTVTDAAILAGFDVFGYFDDFAEPGELFLGKPLLGSREHLRHLPEQGVNQAFIAIGSGHAREDIAELLDDIGLNSPTIIHPGSIVASSARIGAGTLVAAGAIVNPNALVGEYCILNTGSIVEHDCVIGDFAHICPGATLAGQVTVQKGAWVGAGSTVIENLRIGQSSVVGAGAVVTRDVVANSTVTGVPAQPNRS